MSELLFTINAVIPLFLIVLVGAAVKRAFHFDSKQASVLNKICYYVLIPCTLFHSAYTCDFSAITDAGPYVLGAVSFIAAVPPLMWLGAKLTKDRKKAGAFANSAFRPNCVLLGIPLAISVLGETDAFPMTLMAMALLPLFNTLGVITLTYFAQGDVRVNWRKLLLSIVTNPLIIALALGFICAALRVRLPEPLLSPIKKLGGAASPLAMLSIGLGFEVAQLRGDRKLVLLASAIKIIVLPAVFTLIAVVLGYRGNALFAVYLVHAVPTAANAAVIADSMGCDGALAGEIVLTTTLASAFTLVLGILLLRHFALL